MKPSKMMKRIEPFYKTTETCKSQENGMKSINTDKFAVQID